ncbi:MAG TPA: xanthine dehydrogenase family protein subunit M [Candidatus Limnocylindrales bacterium]|nr:xanthine dehydrogenase family protein subunit M [Candidatus Limnocylindrales bacterium]
MIPAQFDYVRPAAIHEALQILVDREGEAKILSGGYSLLPLLKLRLASPGLLVDIRDLDGLDEIVETSDGLRIGGRATHRQIHENPVVAGYPMLVDAAGGIGDPQVRNWGTIGGSCAHADPSSDWPAVLLATSASIVLQSAAGTRTVPARGFFVDTFQTAIEPTELLTEVIIPRAPRPSGSAYAKLERRAGDFATVGVAAQLSLGPDGRIASAGIGLTAVAEAPFAATGAEAALVGKEPNEATFQAAGIAAAAESRPGTDSHGPVEYKRAMVKEMVVRALRIAADRAQAQR